MTINRTICLGFIAVITIGAILLTLPISGSSGNWNSPLVALFTSTSAVCVTGLAVVDTGTYFSFWGQLVIALLAQVGGLGYMTLTTLLMLFVRKQFDLKQKLAIQDSFDRPFLLGSANLIKSIIGVTLIFELTGIFLLLIVFGQQFEFKQGLWQAVFHSVSAWNNAGFSLFKDNLMSYHSSIIVNLTITGLIVFGGIGYQVIIEGYFWLVHILKKTPETFIFSLNFKVATFTTTLLLLGGTVAFFFSELPNNDTIANFSLIDKWLTAWFQSVTTRTAGFNTIDIGKMTTAGLFITMGLMFVGASPSGTGGGIKTTTFSILANATKSVLQGKEEIIIYERTVPFTLLLKSVAVVFGSATTVVVATIAICAIDRTFSLVQVLFEVISAFATVGLSTGITGSLSAISQLIIIATMYIGRVGIVLLMAAILGDPRPSLIQYKQENLLVG
jgi:trk system potassium uptake protein TrkH